MNDPRADAVAEAASTEATISTLAAAARRRAPLDAANLLVDETDEIVGAVLGRLGPDFALRVIARLPEAQRERVMPDVTGRLSALWAAAIRYPEGSIGRLMEPAVAVFPLQATVHEAISLIRGKLRDAVFTYGYVVDGHRRLMGVLVMRDLLLADPHQSMAEVMVHRPFHLQPELAVSDALGEVVQRHYPSYPVCDSEGRLLGVVQGYVLFEEQAFEISAQPGRMVGVEKEEHLSTGWTRSLRLRHPWLQVNLVTAFAAALVVGLFEDTIQRLVVLAAFLPVLAGQSGNTGCQALAVTIRGLTLGEYHPGGWRHLLGKEALLGLSNGVLTGFTAGLGMLFYAHLSGAPAPWLLGLVVLVAMTGSCIASGVAGVVVPLTLRRLGADPATASSIFLTTATDVVSMGLLLGIATILVH